ncbi:hypothetical protein [Mangrovibacterium marinum]|uniref:Type I restriction enzyme R protein N-terminal domain-containing protein n=1 Tax=Mangrovibacterium marinum TaxID=1639118 RepID=A0A2T5C0J0_9BACT|nr:hypothetical protein [Mangrovibacterium marinum]PTN08092.1 hypothetical protein C8N47_111133 [Mangrovibacterium marinum]
MLIDIEGKRIWQQACGDTDRNYSSICLKWDVILNGPGYAGAYPRCQGILKADGWKSRKMTDIERFAKKMQIGDLVVLRLGTKTIVGVGVIVDDYDWQECFADIDGWDLQHVRRVKWLWNGQKNPKYFDTYALKQGDTTQLMTSKVVKDWLSQLEIPDDAYSREIKILPEVGSTINQNQIAEYLFEHGISSNSIEILTREFDELRRIARWYIGKEAPSEFETVAYLVVPILRALGWTPQKMSIEWHNVDIALFDQLPRNDDNLSVVVEAKKKDNSCLTAKSQAQGYANGKKNCKRLIVTDGLRYGVYVKKDDEYELKAYFNLTDLREKYPVYECLGVKEALTIMTPEWKE